MDPGLGETLPSIIAQGKNSRKGLIRQSEKRGFLRWYARSSRF